MVRQSRKELQSVFYSGAKPSAGDFRNLFESVINIYDDGLEKPPGSDTPLRISARGETENLLDVYAGDVNTWRLNQRPVNATHSGLNFETGGISKLFLESSSGNLGLSITQPTAKLHIQQSGSQDALRIDDDAGDTTPLIVNTDGRVGVGTASPSDKLTVKGGDVKIEGGRYRRLKIVSDEYWAGIELVARGNGEDGNPHIDFTKGDLNAPNYGIRLHAPANNRFVIEGGNVGIGVHPGDYALNVKGDQYLSGNLTVKGTGNSSDAGNLWISGTLSVTQATTLTGNVGIGGGAGSAKLEVTGNTTITGNLTVNGKISGSIDSRNITGKLAIERLPHITKIGNFTIEDQDEWPQLIWCRNLANDWDEGLIKYSSQRGQFGRAGYGIHIHENREFGVLSSNLNRLFAIEGRTGNTYIKGNLQVGSVIESDATRHLRHHMYPAEPIVYQNIFSAKDAGAIKKLGNPSHYDDTTYRSRQWNDRLLIAYGGNNETDGNGAEVTIPNGYNTVWVRVLGERWTAIKAYFLEGDRRQLGLWIGGWRSANCYCPDGSLTDSYHNIHQWLPIPAGRSGRLALVAKQRTESNFWISGLAFSKNPWAHAAQSAVVYYWASNGGNATKWETNGNNWNNDVLAYLPSKSNLELKVPVMPSGRDKLLYLIEHNNNWNGCMHNSIEVNGTQIERLMATYDNPFARHWNSKFYERYIAARIPANLIRSNARHLNVKINMSTQNNHIYFREIGTHDLEVPISFR